MHNNIHTKLAAHAHSHQGPHGETEIVVSQIIKGHNEGESAKSLQNLLNSKHLPVF